LCVRLTAAPAAGAAGSGNANTADIKIARADFPNCFTCSTFSARPPTGPSALPAPCQKSTGVSVLPYAVPAVNKHSQTMFVAVLAVCCPWTRRKKLIAPHQPFDVALDLMRLSGGAIGSLCFNGKQFSPPSVTF
jgi:hypothetical protein